MSDPRHKHEFEPNRKGRCRVIIGSTICGLDESAPVHKRFTKPSTPWTFNNVYTEAEWRHLVLGLSYGAGACWCEMSIGNPMVKEHSASCKMAQEMMERSAPERCPDCGFETSDADAMYSHCCQ